jgi:hypothetical protein
MPSAVGHPPVAKRVDHAAALRADQRGADVVTTPTNVVLALALTGRHVATDFHVGSVEPRPMPPTPQRADERPRKSSGNGVVFFKPQGRSRWAVRARHWGLALLVIATLAGLVLLALVVASAGSTPYSF